MSDRVVLASGNAGKLNEFQQLLADCDIDVAPQSEFSVPEVAETGRTFVENAILKARCASHYAGLPAIADDSGLEVDYLKGAPGIYSARFSGHGESGEDASDARNNQKLLELMQDVPEEQRTARFQCLLVYLRHPDDPTPLICQGTWEGRILFEPKGDNGFGYDPLFLVPEHNCASAELPKVVKNQISHRGKAMANLLQKLKI
ncbi:RdgB/HAM1 family non-canonical purine NTP pyrophosphatase [Porticoccus sp. W117]|uniref:RdgB/HAM1 family non-canonical purine NTP pyrophosphatase n=1 Tax=Porticoccus sp. W117 TaxID=3054777 RepID=UPI002599E6A8|nr:RdgB/HAM1 family non-canonical purine NTP pyrophosphatase [Porticoccus sp. W117]MDM3872039.1 RdgB/HAM1 family non-canonical purine NTP pyrophosphatase [Porticoccus sp. W117]